MNIYVGATRQNDGKTMISLGLLMELNKFHEQVGYIKPVGQRYQVIDREQVDKDAVLMQKVFGLDSKLTDMNPIAVPKGFTENYIRNGDREDLVGCVEKAYKSASSGKQITLIEGTGHAGVGSVFDMSNADVAALLGSKVVLVTTGGIGRPIDEVMLNKPVFDAKGVEVAGVIVNKVLPEKYEKIDEMVRLGFKRKGIEVLGVIPFEPILSRPTMQEVLNDLKGELISGQENLSQVVDNYVIAAMASHNALDYLAPNTLLITPGNRDDIVLIGLTTAKERMSGNNTVGIVLTCGERPHPNIMKLLTASSLPTVIVQEDTYITASKLAHTIRKILPEQKDKISHVNEVVEKYVDVQRLLEIIKE